MPDHQNAGTEQLQPDQRRTRIVATLGPSTASYEKIKALHQAGADFFRLNFSHGTHEDHRRSVETIRRIEQDLGTEIGIIADLQGPKLRIGAFENDRIELKTGMTIRFDSDDAPGDETRVGFPHPEVIEALEKGARILMDDGNVALRVVESGHDYFIAEVEYGSALSSRKGVNVPDLSVPIPALTQKDYEDLDYALGLNVDWIAQSFVQTGADVAEAKSIIKDRAGLIAKIEKPAALENFADILNLADAAMVARGDLGVEIPLEKVPAVQKDITYKAREAGKPVIIATQMLESMIENPSPTRAEASDVANAIFDGAHAVMLSGETATGRYPVKAVDMMRKIATEMESGTIHSLSMRAGQSRCPELRLFQIHRNACIHDHESKDGGPEGNGCKEPAFSPSCPPAL